MSKVVAGITTSVDGYITGPDDEPGKGLGEGGERLHHWVFGGPWTYADETKAEPAGEDAEWLSRMTSRIGAVVAGRGTYEAARHWGDQNPWEIPLFIVTHRPEEEPEGGDFAFVSGVEAAVGRARSPGRRQAALRGVLAVPGPRAARREAVAVRDVHRLPAEALIHLDMPSIEKYVSASNSSDPVNGRMSPRP